MKTLALAAAALLPSLASASGLLGSTVDVRYDYVNGAQAYHTLDSVVVGAGVELTCGSGPQLCLLLTARTQTVDLGNNTIRYDYLGDNGAASGFDNVAVNRFDFESLYGNDTVITGITLDGSSIPQLDASRLSFTTHSVQIDMHGLPLGSQASFQISLQTSAVPEPAGAALLAGGLGLLALRRRR